MQKPAVEEIQKWYVGLKDRVYGGRNAKMEQAKDLFDGNIDCAQPPDWPTHVPPTAKRIIRWGANQLISDIPLVEVDPSKATAEGKRNADLARLFSQNQLELWDRTNDIPPLKEAGAFMCLYGMAALKGPLYNYHIWGKRPTQAQFKEEEKFIDAVAVRESLKKLYPAITVKAVHPGTLYPDIAGRFIIEAYQRLVIDVRANWPEWDPGRYGDFDTVTWLEFWSNEWKCFLAGGVPVLKGNIQRNPYGFQPYAWHYSGWGMSSVDGKPEEKCVGLYDGLKSSFEAEARGYTAVDNQLRKDVYGRFFSHSDFNPESASPEPGAITPAPEGVAPGEVLALWPEARVNPDLYRQLAMIDSNIERMTSYRISPFPFAGESGLHAQVGISAERLNYAPPRRALREIVSTVLVNTLHLVKEVIGEAIPITGDKKLKPENIDEPVSLRVKLEGKEPEEDRERIRAGLDMMSRKARSLDTFLREDVRCSDPDAEMAQIIAEDTLFTDMNLRRALGIRAIEKLGMEDALAALEQVGQEGARRRPMGRTPAPPPAVESVRQRAEEQPRPPLMSRFSEEM